MSLHLHLAREVLIFRFSVARSHYSVAHLFCWKLKHLFFLTFKGLHRFHNTTTLSNRHFYCKPFYDLYNLNLNVLLADGRLYCLVTFERPLPVFSLGLSRECVQEQKTSSSTYFCDIVICLISTVFWFSFSASYVRGRDQL